MPGDSQLALHVAKTRNAANGSVNGELDNKTNMISLMRQNSLCQWCCKCFSERKKLIAHRKICPNRLDNPAK